MTAKDFLNYKKPHFWTALVIIIVLLFAGAVGIYQKYKPVSAPLEETVKPEIQTEIEEPEKEETPKDTGEIILDRFKEMNWDEVKAQAKAFGEEGWEHGIVQLAELPEYGIALYGYNDAEYQYRGVAVEHNGNVSYFDWTYMSSTHVQPEMFWNADANQLQVLLTTYDGTGIAASELHVLVEHDTSTMEDFVFRQEDYLAMIKEKMGAVGAEIGGYVDIRLGKTMMLQFEPVKMVDGEVQILKLHQAVIHLNPSKDGFEFSLGEIGVEPEKRTSTVQIEGVEEHYTEVEFVSSHGYSIWYPETMKPETINGFEGFVQGEQKETKITIVPEKDEMDLDENYLKEATATYKASGEYKKVTVSKIQKLKADDPNVSIQMIEAVHDDTADRFYLVKGKDSVLLITASMQTEALEGVGVRIDEMIKTISFVSDGANK